MKCQKYIARCHHVYQHERNENASFLSIFKGGGRPKWRFLNFPRFWKNSSALGSCNCIFENNSLKALFGQNMKKVKILKLSPDSRYLQKLALNNVLFLLSFLIQSTPDNSNLQGNRKKVRVIGSSKKIAESKVKNSFYCTANILITFNCRNFKWKLRVVVRENRAKS